MVKLNFYGTITEFLTFRKPFRMVGRLLHRKAIFYGAKGETKIVIDRVSWEIVPNHKVHIARLEDKLLRFQKLRGFNPLHKP